MGSKKKEIPEQIRDALISQQDLAKLVGVSNATFTRKMQNNNFDKKELKIIQNALRIVLYEY